MDRDQTMPRLKALQTTRTNMAALNALNRRWLRSGFVNIALLLLFLLLTLLLAGGTAPEPATVPEAFSSLTAAAVLPQARLVLRVTLLILFLLTAASFANIWLRANLSTGLALVVTLLLAAIGWLLFAMRLPGRVFAVLSALAALGWLIQSLLWERVSVASDYEPSSDLTTGWREEIVDGEVITTLWRNRFDQELTRETVLFTTSSTFAMNTRHPQEAWAYAELPLADLQAVRVDAKRRKVTLLSRELSALILNNRRWPALNDRHPQRRYKLSFFVAETADWQRAAHFLERQRGLVAEVDRELPELLLRCEERGKIRYCGRPKEGSSVSTAEQLATRAQREPEQCLPYHDVLLAGEDLAVWQAAHPEAQISLLDADSDWVRVPSVDVIAQRRDRLIALTTGLLTLLLSLMLQPLAQFGLIITLLLALLTLIQVLAAEPRRWWLAWSLAALLPAAAGIATALWSTVIM